MFRSKAFCAIRVVSLLAGCATPYQSDGMFRDGGFSETQLSPNVWRVSFAGNEFSRPERAGDLALLRSADLTLQNGYTHFALADARESSRSAAFTTPITSTTTGTTSLIGNTAYGTSRTTITGGYTTFASYPSASNTVVMFKGQPEGVPVVFDAAFICQSVGKKYEASCEAMKQKQ